MNQPNVDKSTRTKRVQKAFRSLPMLLCETDFCNSTASTFSGETVECCGGEEASLISITYVLLHSGHFVSPETDKNQMECH